MRLQRARAAPCLTHGVALLLATSAFDPGRAALASEPARGPIVDWRAPEGCPGADAVSQRLTSLTAASLEQLAAAGEVHGAIERAPQGWRLSLQIRAHQAAPSVPRTLRASDCDELADAAAVAIALALGDAVPPQPLEGTPASNAAASDEAPGASTDSRVDSLAGGAAEAEEPSSRPELAFAARAGLIVDSASVGGLALGPRAGVQVRYARWAAGLHGLWLPARETVVADGQSVDVSLRAAGLDACYRTSEQAVSIDLCAGVELGLVQGSGRGLAQARERRDFWIAPNWGARGSLALARSFSIELQLDAILPLGRERYVVDDFELVYEVPDTSLRAGLALAGTL